MAKKIEIVIPPGRLWPNTPSGAAVEIEVFGSTGEYKSGKTLLGLTIAPGVHPEGHAFSGRPRTLYLDFEKSGGTYGGTGCNRVDVPAKMVEAHPSGYRPLDVFTWFSAVVGKIQPGQYDVLIADPVTDIESGLVDFVKKNCGQFGLTDNQIQKGGGLLWGAVKDHWKSVLLALASKVKCFYFTSHLRDEWKGSTNTGRREPKGKETLMELASLYLWLERKPDANGLEPREPSAIVLKQRLADTTFTTDGTLSITPLMPPRIPVATVQTIRRYIASPPNYEKLHETERVIEKPATEEELLRLRVAAAEAERDTEQTRLAALARRAELQAGVAASAAMKPQTSDQVAANQASKAAGRAAELQASAEQAEIDRINAEAQAKLAAAQAEGERLKASTPPEDRMIIENKPKTRTQATPTDAAPEVAKVEPVAEAAQTTPPPAGVGDPASVKCTMGQKKEITKLGQELGLVAIVDGKPTPTGKLQTMLSERAGVSKVGELSQAQAAKLIEVFLGAIAKRRRAATEAAMLENDIPF